MYKSELQIILENHIHWLKQDCDGWESMRANLCRATLCEANLREANLREVNLCGADLYGACNVPYISHSCPEEGCFIGYKKAQNNKIVELEILSDSKRCSAAGRKCRCDKAKVLRILNTDRTDADISEIPSKYDESFIYRVGEIAKVDNFDTDRWNECAPGIHFFINFQEAVEY